MPTPAPAADQNATPVYGIRYPKATSKAYQLPRDFEDLAEDMETILGDAGMPPVITGTPVVAASSGARDTHWGVPTNATQRLALQGLGAETIRTDTGITERYYAALMDGGTNLGGRATAGWYTVSTAPVTVALRTTNQSIANGTSTPVAIAYDASPIHNDVPGTFTPASGTFVATVAGLYKITAQASFDINATGSRIIQIGKALAATPTVFTVTREGYAATASGGREETVPVVNYVQLAVGDVVRAQVLQNSGAALNITNAQLEIRFA